MAGTRELTCTTHAAAEDRPAALEFLDDDVEFINCPAIPEYDDDTNCVATWYEWNARGGRP
jgi:hypothetical protein